MDFEAALQKRIAAYEYHMRRLGCGVCKLDYRLDHYCKDFEEECLVQSCNELSLLLQSFDFLALDKRDYFLLSASLLLRLTPTLNKSGRFDYVRLVESNETAVSEETFERIIQIITPSYEEIEASNEPFTPDLELSPEDDQRFPAPQLGVSAMAEDFSSDWENCYSQYNIEAPRSSLHQINCVPDQNIANWLGYFRTPLTFALAASPVMERCVGFGCPGPPTFHPALWIV